MDSQAPRLILAEGREKPVLNKHPWIFSGSIAKTEGAEPRPGDTVEVLDANQEWLARGYYNPKSQIRVRILTWQKDEPIDRDFWRRRLLEAAERRSLFRLEPETTAYRVINAEADGLPGLVVDKYTDYLVVQCLTLGIDQRKEQIAQILVELFNPNSILERSDVNIRKKEGLSKVVSVLAGEGPPPQLQVLENGIKMNADLYQGHKTGLYLDQRDNRKSICHTDLVKDREILNVFAYTGGFSLYAAHNGAGPITSVEVSAQLLNQIEENLRINHLDRSEDSYISGDAFQVLRQMRDKDQKFDFIILDPPKFAHHKRDISAACRGYKDINLLALGLLRPNGLLATFSCSGAISQELFQKVLFGAASDAERNVQIIRYLYQASDHPVLLSFPESFYLKGFLCRVY